jgi:hypothetical protein
MNRPIQAIESGAVAPRLPRCDAILQFDSISPTAAFHSYVKRRGDAVFINLAGARNRSDHGGPAITCAEVNA